MSLTSEKKRVVSVLSCDGNGKTSIIRRLHETKDPIKEEAEEEKRSYTLFSKTYASNLRDQDLFLIDSSGSLNYINDAINSIRVSDGALYVVDSTTGVIEQDLRFWWKLNEYKRPALLFVNKMDDINSDFDMALESIKKVFKISPLPVIIPVGKGAELKGVISLITNKMYTYKDDTGKSKEMDIPEDYKDLVSKYREQMIEAVVETDEVLMQKYFEGAAISDDELRTALGKAVRTRHAFPVFSGSSLKNIGTDILRNAFFHYFPSSEEICSLQFNDESFPENKQNAPFSSFVYKVKIDNYTGKLCYLKVASGTINKASKLVVSNTGSSLKISKLYRPDVSGLKTIDEASVGDIVILDKCDELRTGQTVVENAISNKVFIASPEPRRVLTYALELEDKKLEEKVVGAIKKICDEDPSISYTRVRETKEFVVSGLGQLQLDVLNEMLSSKYNLKVKFRAPRIQYRETISRKAQVQGKHKKQSGGHGQFADTWIKFEPQARNAGFEFVDQIVGGAIPKNYIPSVEKGIRASMERGYIAGFPVIDMRATLYDGSYHDVDSSDMAFQIAASQGFKKAMEEASPILLEPIMDISVNVPDQFVGAITNDLSGRRGRIKGMDSSEFGSTVSAMVPLSELSTYAPELHSMTQGLGVFEMQFNTYEEVPSQNLNKIVEEVKKWRTDETTE